MELLRFTEILLVAILARSDGVEKSCYNFQQKVVRTFNQKLLELSIKSC